MNTTFFEIFLCQKNRQYNTRSVYGQYNNLALQQVNNGYNIGKVRYRLWKIFLAVCLILGLIIAKLPHIGILTI